MIYRIRNWSECQHYKDRNPPWIKLKVSIISSRDWVLWDDKSRVLAVACMALATRTNGEIDGSETGLTYLQKAASLNSRPNLKPLIDSGFLIVVGDIETLAPCASGSVSVSVPISVSGDRGAGEGISPECFELAERLRAEILKNNPTAKTPTDLTAWAKCVALMLRRDRRTIQQIQLVIDFSQYDSFWKQNVLSMDAVRRQFDRLVIKMKQNSPQAKDEELLAELKKWERK